MKMGWGIEEGSLTSTYFHLTENYSNGGGGGAGYPKKVLPPIH